MPARKPGWATRAILKDLRNFALYWSGAYAWASYRLRKRQAIVALNVHRILSREAMLATNSPEGMNVSKHSFDAMCACIDKCLRFATPDELEHRKSDRRLPVLLTLDDGWKDNVAPLTELAKRGASAIIFVCTGRMGQSNPFWPELAIALWKHSDSRAALLQRCELSPAQATSDAVLSRLKQMDAAARTKLLNVLAVEFPPALTEIDCTMTWEDVRQLRDLGIAFGSHGRTHEIMPPLSEQALKDEVCISKSELTQTTGPCTMLAYPNGDCDGRTREQVASAGYRFAFLNSPGAITPESDPLALPRTNLSEKKITDRAGRFSKYAFLHATVWSAYRAGKTSVMVIVPTRANRTTASDRLPAPQVDLS